MRGVLIRFLKQDILSEHPAVYWGVGIIWLFLMIAAFASLRTQSFGISAKIFWILFLLFIPVIGLACYCLFCLTRGDWSGIKPLLIKPSAVTRVSPEK